jgi:uncharacterized membrane protein (DUF485 family)
LESFSRIAVRFFDDSAVIESGYVLSFSHRWLVVVVTSDTLRWRRGVATLVFSWVLADHRGDLEG